MDFLLLMLFIIGVGFYVASRMAESNMPADERKNAEKISSEDE